MISRVAVGLARCVATGPMCRRARGLSMDMSFVAGRKTRSLEEQLKKLKKTGDDDQATASGISGGEGAAKPKTVGAGTMTLAERLSQSLKDPLKAKGFLGTVTKGEAEIQCHEVCKVIVLKDKRGLIDNQTLSNLVNVVEVSDQNWFDKYTIMRGEKELHFRGIDIRSLASFGAAKKGGIAEQMPFLEDLFLLGYRITKSPKNRILIMNGFFLGAGAPLALCHLNLCPTATAGSNSKNFCIASTKTVFSIQAPNFLAMTPGCGASYFLPRLKGHLGLYIALTGVRLNAADCMFAGLATHFMPPDRLDRCVKELVGQHEGIAEKENGLNIGAILDSFATSPLSAKGFKTFEGPSSTYATRYSDQERTDATHLEANHQAIARCFGKSSVDEIFTALLEEGTLWAKTTLDALRRMSPTALHVTFELLRRGGTSSALEESIRTEWRVAKKMFERPDFFEGVRAFEGDKDGLPKWAPSPTKEEVQSLFRPMSDGELKQIDLTQHHLVKGHNKFGKGEPRV